MGLLDQPYTAFMLFMLLCFSGLMVMFFFMQRSIEELTRRMRDERNEVMEALRAVEKRLSQVTAPQRTATSGGHVHFGRDGRVVFAENEGADTSAAESGTAELSAGAGAYAGSDPQAPGEYFSADDPSAYSEAAELDDAEPAPAVVLPELDIQHPGNAGKNDATSRMGRGLQLAGDDAVIPARTPPALFEESREETAASGPFSGSARDEAVHGPAKHPAEDSAGSPFDMTEFLQLSRQEEDPSKKRRSERRGKDKAAAPLTLDPYPAAVMTGIAVGSDEPEGEVSAGHFRMPDTADAADDARESAEDHAHPLFSVQQGADEEAGRDAEDVIVTASRRAGEKGAGLPAESSDMQGGGAAGGPDFTSDFMHGIGSRALPDEVVPEVMPGLMQADTAADTGEDDESLESLYTAYGMESDGQAGTAVTEDSNGPVGPVGPVGSVGPEFAPVYGRGTAQVLYEAQEDDSSAHDTSVYDTPEDDDEEVILLTPEEIVEDDEDDPVASVRYPAAREDYFGKGGGRLFSFFDEEEEEAARPVQTAGSEDYAPADRSLTAADAPVDDAEADVFSVSGVFSGSAETAGPDGAAIPADDDSDAPIDMDSALAKALAAAGITDDAPPADGSRYLSDASVGQEAGSGESMDFVWEDDTVPASSGAAQSAGAGKKKRDREAGEASDNITEYIVPE